MLGHIELDNFKREPEPELPKRPPFRMRKFWITAANQAGMPRELEVNRFTLLHYHRLLAKIKLFYAPLNEYVFEKDTRFYSKYNHATMHQFLCSSLYFELECSPNYLYQVNVRFDNCPFEQDIRMMLQTYPLNKRYVEYDTIASVSSFFASIKGVFDQNCFSTLKATVVNE